jgi:hypothetical protein
MCSLALDFPSYDGRNVDAWIDCLSSADDPEAEMVAHDLVVGPDDVLTLHLGQIGDFVKRCPDQQAALAVDRSLDVQRGRIVAR